MYKYDGKKLAWIVWALFTFYGFATVGAGNGFADNIKGWIHVALYSISSGAILLIILAIIREKTEE